MSACVWRRRGSGGALRAAPWVMAWAVVGAAVGLGSAGCKAEAQATAAAPDAAPDPAPDVAPDAAGIEAEEPSGEAADGDPTLAAGSPTALETPPSDVGADGAPEEVAGEPQAAAEPEPTVPDEPYRVLLLGDSLIATGIGALLEKKLDAHPHVVCFRKGKSSSGLARPDFFDWPDQARRQIDFREPDLVVVILGGNDGQDLTRRSNGEGRRVAWSHEDWADAYRERVDDFLVDLTADGRTVLWLGLPTMGLRSLERKLVLIRDIQRDAVEALGDRGVYLDTAPFVTTSDGDLLQQARVGPRNKLQNLRSEDRIHFTMAGSEYVADRVYPSVLEALGLSDVQPDPRPDH